MAAKLTIRTNGQTLITALYKQDGSTGVSVFTDQNLSSSTTVGTITSDTTYWVSADDHYILSVTQPDGSQIANSAGATAKLYLAAGSPVEVSPMPTAAQLAADLAPDRLWLPATVWSKGGNGSAVLSSPAVASRWPGWSMDDTASENIVSSVYVPWGSFAIYNYWGTGGGASGNVKWELTYNLVTGNGDDLSSGDVAVSTSPAVSAAPASSSLTVQTYATVTGATAGIYHLRMLRNGGDAGDTLVGDAQFLGLLLVKV